MEEEVDGNGEYTNDMVEHWLELELRSRIDVNYMSNFQLEVTPKSRSILTGWMVAVMQKDKASHAAFLLAVSLLDRVSQTKQIVLQEYQNLGAVCIFIASKYEDMNYVCLETVVDRMSSITKMDEAAVLQLELEIAERTNFVIPAPTTLRFANAFCTFRNVDCTARALVEELLLICALDYEMLYFLPSQVAEASIWLVYEYLDLRFDQEPPTLDVQHCMTAIHLYITNKGLPQMRLVTTFWKSVAKAKQIY